MRKLLILPFMTVLLSIGTSCSSDEENTNQSDTELAKESAAIEVAESFDFDLVLDVEDLNFSRDFTEEDSISKNGCVVVTTQTTNGGFPKTYTLDFGTGCTSPRGITRTGTIEITLTDMLRNPGAVATVERRNYTINGRGLSGLVTYTNTSTSTSIQWNRNVSNGSFTSLNGSVFNFNSDVDTRLIQGAGTLTRTDDVVELFMGNRTVSRPNGSSLTITISQPLLKPYTCANITQGVLDFNGTVLQGSLDYGSGACDNQAVYTTVTGNTINITL